MKRSLLVLVVIAGLLSMAGAVLMNGRQPEPLPPGSESALRLKGGPFMVHAHEEVFVDPSRPTRANGDYPGAPDRTLVGKVWHPESNAQGPYPLVVYSHGFSSTWEGGAYLGEHLASLGYVVVAVSYPLTNFEAPGGPNARDVMNQPGDVSFLIDTLLTQSATAGHMLEGMVDESRVGATGISLGGMTTTLAAYHPEIRDPRIGAALSIAGPTFIFSEKFFSVAQLPFLMLAGDIDALVPYDSNAAPVPDKVPGGELVTVTGASHTGFAGPAANLRWMDNPDAIGCWVVNRNIGDVAEEPWYELIGTPEQGIIYGSDMELCGDEALPPALNVLRQHMITALVVGSFFQSHFSPDPAQRAASQRFLGEVLPRELAEVSYRN